MLPKLFIIVPCYNEEEVLPVTAPLFLGKITELVEKGKIAPDSRVLFVNDGSKDSTWEIIEDLSRQNDPARMRFSSVFPRAATVVIRMPCSRD